MKSKKTERLVLLAFFVAIEIVVMTTPLGYIPLGVTKATTLHIPVIIAGILLGKKEGAIIGFVFGLTSLIMNTISPTITSFVFTPFYSVGGVSGNFLSLIICFVPRILLGYIAGFIYEKLKFKSDIINISISAVIATFLHTTLVLSGIYLFFGAPYAAAKGIEMSALIGVLLTVVATNGIMEMIVAAIISVAVVKAIHVVRK